MAANLDVARAPRPAQLLLAYFLLSTSPFFTGADAVITFSQGEFSIDILDIVKWEVEGLVTVLIGGSNPRSFVLDCTTDQANSGNLVWTRVGSSTVPFDVQALGNGTRLDMASITYSHLGDYRCSNTVTGESRTINITIANPAVEAVHSSLDIVVGHSGELEVYVSGIPYITSPDVAWFRIQQGDKSLVTEDMANFFKSNKRMVLTEVTEEDGGTYRCIVTQSGIVFGTVSPTASVDIVVTVVVPASIVSDPVNATVSEWSDVSISCIATGNPLPTVTWMRFDGGVLPVNHLVNEEEIGNTINSTLVIERVRYDDAGSYYCKATVKNTESDQSLPATITVLPDLEIQAIAGAKVTPITDGLYSIILGQMFRVECYGSGDLQWTAKKGVAIPTSPSGGVSMYQVKDLTRDVLTLYFQAFSMDEVDVYTCTSDMTNSLGMFVSEDILITFDNPAVFSSIETQYAKRGGNTTLQFAIYASPQADSIEWYFENTLIQTANDERFEVLGDGILFIMQVEDALLGSYSCRVTVGEIISSDSIELVFATLPVVTVTPPTASVSISDSVSLECSVDGLPQPEIVRWSHASLPSLPVGVTQEGTSLVFEDVTISDAGTYVCSATNLAGTTTASAELIVNYGPIVRVCYNKVCSSGTIPPQIFSDGNTLPHPLVCEGEGNPPPILSWDRPPLGLPDGTHISGENPQELDWLRELEYSDSGTYVCTAASGIEENSAEISLTVEAPPLVNTIVPVPPVVSIENGLYAVPVGHVGEALVCTGFGWPLPSIRWERSDGTPLPDGMSYSIDQPAQSGSVIQPFLSAILVWDQAIQPDQAGQYSCVVFWEDNPQATDKVVVRVDIDDVTTTPGTAMPLPDNKTLLFQVRILTDDCSPATMEGVADDLLEIFSNAIESGCTRCGAIDVSLVEFTCSADVEGALLFQGRISGSSVADAQAAFDALLYWQKTSPQLRIGADLYQVDSTCSLYLDSTSDPECVTVFTTAVTSTRTEILLVFYVSVPLAVMIVVCVVLIPVMLGAVFCLRKRSQTDPESVNPQNSVMMSSFKQNNSQTVPIPIDSGVATDVSSQSYSQNPPVFHSSMANGIENHSPESVRMRIDSINSDTHLLASQSTTADHLSQVKPSMTTAAPRNVVHRPEVESTDHVPAPTGVSAAATSATITGIATSPDQHIAAYSIARVASNGTRVVPYNHPRGNGMMLPRQTLSATRLSPIPDQPTQPVTTDSGRRFSSTARTSTLPATFRGPARSGFVGRSQQALPRPSNNTSSPHIVSATNPTLGSGLQSNMSSVDSSLAKIPLATSESELPHFDNMSEVLPPYSGPGPNGGHQNLPVASSTSPARGGHLWYETESEVATRDQNSYSPDPTAPHATPMFPSPPPLGGAAPQASSRYPASLTRTPSDIQPYATTRNSAISIDIRGSYVPSSHQHHPHKHQHQHQHYPPPPPPLQQQQQQQQTNPIRRVSHPGTTTTTTTAAVGGAAGGRGPLPALPYSNPVPIRRSLENLVDQPQNRSSTFTTIVV